MRKLSSLQAATHKAQSRIRKRDYTGAMRVQVGTHYGHYYTISDLHSKPLVFRHTIISERATMHAGPAGRGRLEVVKQYSKAS